MPLPPVVVYRSIHRGRVVYAVPGWLVAETSQHLVTATVPGDETLQLLGSRHDVIADLAADRARTGRIPWRTNRVLWMTPWRAAHSIGHFWNHSTGEFICYYVNLQDVLTTSPFGYDSRDHLLDIVVAPDGAWRWKDEDELATGVERGLISAAEAAAARAEGERVIAMLPSLIPTGWEAWQPDPRLPPLRLPAEIETIGGLRCVL